MSDAAALPALIREGFEWQIFYCREMDSPLTADVLAAVLEVLDHSTQTGAGILDWAGDPKTDALMLRIAGGLNALARSGRDAELTALYAARHGDWPGVLARALRDHDTWLCSWLDSAPQTNEVARSGVLYPGLIEIARRFGPRLELLELGASAGLNLNLDRYGYTFGPVSAGDPASPVRLAPEWSGPLPRPVPIEVTSRAGVDLNPLDLGDNEVVARLLAYIWPDQAERLARAEAAIAVARAHPVQIDRADGADWIEAQLASPQKDGVTRVVFHSIALQYFPMAGQHRVKAAIERAGAAATQDRPLAWLAMEFPSMNQPIELSLRAWPGGGERQRLAICHPHGAKVAWVAGD